MFICVRTLRSELTHILRAGQGAVGAAGLGLGAWYLNSGSKQAAPASKKEEAMVPKKAENASKVFTGGDQGFIPLTLDLVEDINHNTKKFRFKFEDKDAVSGLTIASALITKYKGPEDEKPTIRPYTPTSDEGMMGNIHNLRTSADTHLF